MQSAIREELTALREVATQLNERVERLERLLGEEEDLTEVQRQAEEEFRQKYPNIPISKALLRLVGTIPPNPPEQDWEVIRRAVVEHYYRKRHENSDS